MKTIRALNRTSGVTVVLITHHMDEAAQADRLVVMAKGKHRGRRRAPLRCFSRWRACRPWV